MKKTTNLMGALTLIFAAGYATPSLAVDGLVDGVLTTVEGVVNGLPVVGSTLAGVVDQVGDTLSGLTDNLPTGDLPVVGGLLDGGLGGLSDLPVVGDLPLPPLPTP